MRPVLIFIVLVLVGSGLAGCYSTPKRSLAPSLEPSLGKQVTLVGIAEPRKGGAALNGEGFYVWLKDVDSWPENVAMKRVEVRGRLEEDHGLPVIADKPNDPFPSQGIAAPEGMSLKEASRRLILIHPTWRVLE